MKAYITARRLRRGLGAFAVLATLPAAACSSVENVLEVTDPDIINPGDVGNAAGAEAVRLGALARFQTATSGGESIWLLGGLFADEYRSGDTFNQRDQTDKREITYENANIETAYTNAHRARVSALQAIDALTEFAPNAPDWQIAEMYFVQAYTENMLAEAFCSGVPFSSVKNGAETYGEQITTTAAFERALAHADSGLALVTGDTPKAQEVQNALKVIRGRILLNLGRYQDAAAAVAGVPRSFAYVHQHSQTTRDNSTWALNNNQGRWVVADGEGGNGIDFARANDPRVPVCAGGSDECDAVGAKVEPFDSNLPITMYSQLIWPSRETSAMVIGGVEASLIRAEAQLQAGNVAAAMDTLNVLRSTVAGLAPLTAAGSTAGTVDQIFTERAFWLFGTGVRQSDLRRLVRQYNRPAADVFPSGTFFKGGEYGTQTSFPIPQDEENNPNVGIGSQASICLDTNA